MKPRLALVAATLGLCCAPATPHDARPSATASGAGAPVGGHLHEGGTASPLGAGGAGVSPPLPTAAPDVGPLVPSVGLRADACRSDADCVVTTFAGCCKCDGCPTPRAVSRETDRNQRRPCAADDCGMGPCTPLLVCPPAPPLTTLEARCVGGGCALVSR